MVVIGIAGGIGAGKSTVAQAFAQLGAHVFDADRITHRLMRPGQPVWRRICAQFELGILSPTRRIDRQALARIVFGSRKKLERLTRIVHPAVRAEIQKGLRRLKRRAHSVVVLDVPLLLESGSAYPCDALVVVTAPRHVVLKRLRGRRGWDEAQLSRRERFQFPVQVKVRGADFIVRNGGTHAATHRQVLRIWKRIQRGEIASLRSQ